PHMRAIHHALQDIPGEQDMGLAPALPMTDRPALEMPAAADQRHIGQDLSGLARPESDRRVGPHHPLPVTFMNIDGDISERPAPFDDHRIIMRMRNPDRLDGAALAERRY